VPDLIGEKATEASHLFCSRVRSVEEPAGGELGDSVSHRELPVWSEGLIQVVLGITKVPEDFLCHSVTQHASFQSIVLSLGAFSQRRYKDFLSGELKQGKS
jgi:hypothetical protein